MKRILVAVDGSEHSLRAAKFAAELAAQVSGQLTLTHAVQELYDRGNEIIVPYEAFDRELERSGKAVLRELAEKLDAPSLHADTRLIKGPPAEAVADLAKKEGFDCVVVGSRGKNPLARLLLGSFADRLIHVCETPVLVVR